MSSFNTAPTHPLVRIAELGLVLPVPPPPMANYVSCLFDGDLIYVSGQGPRGQDGVLRTGKVGRDVGVEDACEHARLAALGIISLLHYTLSDIGRVARVVKVLGMVNATADFAAHSQVIDGCSDLLIDVFGDAGRHARSAIGVGSLPNNITVEIELIARVRR